MEKKEVKETLKRSRFRWLKITVGIIAGIWVLALVVMQVGLNSKFLMSMADKYIPRYVNADVHIGNIKASVFKSFPNLNLEISDLTVTYPHDRFAAYDSVGCDGILRHAGRAEAADTLASAHTMTLSVNYLSAILGDIHIHEASMDRPRFFAHSFYDGDANWNVLKNTGSESADTDTTVSPLPLIIVNKVCMTGNPRIFYTDCADTIYAAVGLEEMHFHGRLRSDLTGSKVGLHVDNLFLSGRLPADTVAMKADHVVIDQKGEDISFDASAKAFLGMSQYGRIMLPLDVSGDVRFPKEDVPAVSFKNFRADVATVSMTGLGDVKFYGDSTYLRAEASIDDCKVDDLIQYFGKNFFSEAGKLKTDAKVSFTAVCDGYYNPSRNTMPDLLAEIVIPKASVSYPDIPDGTVALDINANTDASGKVDLSIDNMCLNFGGLDFDLTGTVDDLMGEDPLFDVEGLAYASIDKLMDFVPDSLGYRASGELDGVLTGKIRLSQMTPYNFYKANLDGYLRSKNVTVSSEKDSVYAWLGSPEIGVATVSNKVDRGIPRGTKILAVTAKVDSLYAAYGKDMIFRGSGAKLEAQNAARIKCEKHGENEHHPIVGCLSLGRIFMSGTDSLFAGVIGSENLFKFSQLARGKIMEPQLSLTSNNFRIFAREGVNRYGFRDAKFQASAVMTTFERGQRRNMMLDSLQRVYPGVPRDSLITKFIRSRRAGRTVPDYLADADFRKHDVQIPMGEIIAKYMKEWNLNGSMEIKDGIVITPYFPLRNVIEDVRGTVSNDAIHLDNFTIRPGVSDISATGVLSGLRRALRGYGAMKLDLKITSQKMDANELLTAYSAGAKFSPDSMSVSNTSSVNDAEYLANVSAAHEAAAQDSSYALVVIPANLIANVSLQANEVDYSDLKITWLAADMLMKERCVQLTNTVATSNMGDIYFEGFYSTKTKKDITAGFDLNLADITADKVVQLFPAVDTIMPMLTSFKGMLDCEVAATTDLDTNMNFITSSMNGIMKISGRDVKLEESDAFRKLAKMLMFKNKKTGSVADMSVSGLISNNRLEIFPFVLKIDRYTLAMSGLQNFDQSFKYHVSVLKSPVPFRFGINIFGNFDKWKFRIGKAQYKSTNVPVFTAQIDAMQMNLVSSIHNIFTKGVELAVKQNRDMKNSIDSNKVSMGFNPEAHLDSLDSSQMKMLDSLQTAYESPVDSVLNARMDSLTVVPEVNEESETTSKFQQFIDNQVQNKSAREQKKAEKRRKRQEAKKGEAVLEEN